MQKYRCERCEHLTEIATHQFIKINGVQRFLCKECWEEFRLWFFGK